MNKIIIAVCVLFAACSSIGSKASEVEKTRFIVLGLNVPLCCAEVRGSGSVNLECLGGPDGTVVIQNVVNYINTKALCQ